MRKFIRKITSKAAGYCFHNWKRLLVANVIGFSVQGILIALLLYVGLPGLLSIILAKVASWVLFLATLAR